MRLPPLLLYSNTKSNIRVLSGWQLTELCLLHGTPKKGKSRRSVERSGPSSSSFNTLDGKKVAKRKKVSSSTVESHTSQETTDQNNTHDMEQNPLEDNLINLDLSI